MEVLVEAVFLAEKTRTSMIVDFIFPEDIKGKFLLTRVSFKHGQQLF